MPNFDICITKSFNTWAGNGTAIFPGTVNIVLLQCCNNCFLQRKDITFQMGHKLNSVVLSNSKWNAFYSYRFVITGMTWVFGFLAIEEGRLAFTYLFTILNSLQGFFIFLMFTLREKKIRDHWKKLFNKCCSSKDNTRTGRSATQTTSNGLNDNKYAINTTSESIELGAFSFENKVFEKI